MRDTREAHAQPKIGVADIEGGNWRRGGGCTEVMEIATWGDDLDKSPAQSKPVLCCQGTASRSYHVSILGADIVYMCSPSLPEYCGINTLLFSSMAASWTAEETLDSDQRLAKPHSI